MKQDIYSRHNIDQDGNPQGGTSTAVGVTVFWQNGPLGRGAERREPNGAFVETVIDIAWDRLAFYESGKFACEENVEAMKHLELALAALNRRTARREQREVEGTHGV